MVTNTNLKYADSSSDYHFIIMVKKKSKNFKLENFQKMKCMKCQPKANNNREAVVVCARHVVKRHIKRSVLVCTKRTKVFVHVPTVSHGRNMHTT